MGYKWLYIIGLLTMGLAACGPGTEDNNGTNNGTNNGGNNGTPSCDNPQLLEEADVNGGVTLSAGCYSVESVLGVNDGLLTMEAGVQIVFGQDAGLHIGENGSIAVEGSDSSPVYLTGNVEERAYWKGLRFQDADSPDNSLDYVVLAHAGSEQWHGGDVSRGGIFLQGENNKLAISNSTFRQNAQAAIVADGSGTELTVADSTFEDNETPIWAHSNLLGGLSSLTFTDNDNAYIRTGLSSESVSTEQTWPAIGVPYRSSSTITLDTTLTLAEGLTIMFEQGVGIQVIDEGRLTAVGSSENPITLTGVEEQRGFWKGIRYRDTRSSDNTLDYVVLEYAGSDQWHGGDISRGGIFAEGNGVALSVSNSTFRENAQAGIVADGRETDLSVSSSTFESNEMPLWLHANLVGGLAADNAASGNDEDYVQVGTGGSEVSSNQTWQTLDVPYRIRNTPNVTADLVLSPGMTLEFNQDVGLDISGGTLVADGSSGDVIKFIAADGETLQGFWKGIQFRDSFSSTNKIANAEIRYGGSSGWHGGDASVANLFVRGGGSKAQVALDTVTISHSGSWGISVEGEGSISPCSGVTLEDNGDGSTGGDTSIHEDATYDCN